MRKLTEKEIGMLENQGCRADDWSLVEVDEDDFRVERVEDVCFHGHVCLGGLSGSVEVEEGFVRPCGVRRAVLHDVSVGHDCLIENVHGYVSCYDVGDRVYLSNVGVLTTQGVPTFGEGTVVAVKNEGGDGNVVLYGKLTAQTAWLMLEHESVRSLARREVERRSGGLRGMIGAGSRIVGVKEMMNVRVGESCEVQGASRLTESTILSSDAAPVLVGPDVVLENCVVAAGATVTDGARLYNCFVGESAHVGRGFSGESSLFFANAHMDNGEACAAFCGPFACSHHKSTLLIGGEFSFYNAGSGTNQSNHAYKMGPIHYGTLERGSKTASGSHILWPAQIGAFTMVMGKLTCHPDLRRLPFSYVLAKDDTAWVVPGINIRTVGTWRDVRKWPKRDHRPHGARRDLVNFAFPNPFVIQEVLEGRKLLEQLLTDTTEEVVMYEGCQMRRSAVVKGIQYYDLAIRLFVYEMMNKSNDSGNEAGADEWVDLAGMLAPKREVDRIVADVESGNISTSDELLMVLNQVHADYRANAADYLQSLLQQLSQSMFVEMDNWLAEAEQANRLWLRMVRDDAEHEFQLGDVSEADLREFLEGVK